MEFKKPRTWEEFAEVAGVGQAKLEKYADDFLKVINLTFSFLKPIWLQLELFI